MGRRQVSFSSRHVSNPIDCWQSVLAWAVQRRLNLKKEISKCLRWVWQQSLQHDADVVCSFCTLECAAVPQQRLNEDFEYGSYYCSSTPYLYLAENRRQHLYITQTGCMLVVGLWLVELLLVENVHLLLSRTSPEDLPTQNTSHCLKPSVPPHQISLPQHGVHCKQKAFGTIGSIVSRCFQYLRWHQMIFGWIKSANVGVVTRADQMVSIHL